MIIRANIFSSKEYLRRYKYSPKEMDNIVNRFDPDKQIFGYVGDEIKDPHDVACIVKSLTLIEDNIEAEMKILDTPMGKMVKDAINSGIAVTYRTAVTGHVNEGMVAEDCYLTGILINPDTENN